MDILQSLQAAIEHLSGNNGIPERVYLDACNAMKELHAVTKLFKVTYIEFYVEHAVHLRDGTSVVARRTCTEIMEQYDVTEAYGSSGDAQLWGHVFDTKKLPHDICALRLYDPFTKRGSNLMVTTVEPYLKRARDDSDSE